MHSTRLPDDRPMRPRMVRHRTHAYVLAKNALATTVLAATVLATTVLATGVLAAGVLAGRTAVADEKLPLVLAEHFESGADRWQPLDAKQWRVRTTDRGQVFSQFEKKSTFQPPHRSPFNIALLKEIVVGEMVIDAHVQSTHEDYEHRDVCLVFGYQDPSHMYYVHLGKKTDDHANQIFIVNGAPRTKISTKTTPGTDWDEKWHRIRVVRRPASGDIAVYFDDLASPVMTANDRTFASGQIGIGTFDDTSDWDDIELRGIRVSKP